MIPWEKFSGQSGEKSQKNFSATIGSFFIIIIIDPFE